MTDVDLTDLGLHALEVGSALGTAVDLGWHEIGRGHYAVALGHPDHPLLAIRLSRCMDCWFGYAIHLATGQIDDTRYAPVVHDLRLVDGDGYVALVERLREPTSEEAVFEKTVREALAFPMEGDAALLPGFGAFLAELLSLTGRHQLDGKEGNVLFAPDGRLVVNDPLGGTMPSEARSLLDLLPVRR